MKYTKNVSISCLHQHSTISCFNHEEMSQSKCKMELYFLRDENIICQYYVIASLFENLLLIQWCRFIHASAEEKLIYCRIYPYIMDELFHT